MTPYVPVGLLKEPKQQSAPRPYLVSRELCDVAAHVSDCDQQGSKCRGD